MLHAPPRPFGTSDSHGLASSARCTLLGRPGTTAIAFIGFSTLLKQLGDAYKNELDALMESNIE